MELTFTIHDALTPALKKLATAVQRKDILEAAGLSLMSLTRRAFQEPALRPSPWAPRLAGQGTHSLLKKSGTLWRSIRVSHLSSTSVSVSSDRIYAAIHQFGGTIKPVNGAFLKFPIGGAFATVKQVTIPPRPFFPVTAEGQFTPRAEKSIAKVIELKLEEFAAQL